MLSVIRSRIFDRSKNCIEISSVRQMHCVVKNWKGGNTLSEVSTLDRSNKCRIHEAPCAPEDHRLSIRLDFGIFDQRHARHDGDQALSSDRKNHIRVDPPNLLDVFIGIANHALDLAVQLDFDMCRVDGDDTSNLCFSRHRVNPQPVDGYVRARFASRLPSFGFLRRAGQEALPS